MKARVFEIVQKRVYWIMVVITIPYSDTDLPVAMGDSIDNVSDKSLLVCCDSKWVGD